MQVIMLNYIERHVIDRDPMLRVSDFFDYVGGTSIGGITALGLVTPVDGGRPRPVQDLVNLFERKGTKIFSEDKGSFHQYVKGARFRAEPLEEELYLYFGDKKLSQTLKPVLVVSTKNDGNSYLFESEEAKRDEQHNFLTRDAARATSAAQTYFPAATCWNCQHTQELSLTDGGMTTNNPTKLVRDRLYRKNSNIPIMMLSLGTGYYASQPFPDSASYMSAIAGKYVGGTQNIIDLQMNAVSDLVHQEVKKDIAEPFYQRLQPYLSRDIDLADVSREAQLEMCRLAELECTTVKFHDIMWFLRENRRLRGSMLSSSSSSSSTSAAGPVFKTHSESSSSSSSSMTSLASSSSSSNQSHYLSSANAAAAAAPALGTVKK